LKWGGFPLVCKESDESSKNIILLNIYDSVVLKDIIMRNKVASPVALEKVLAYEEKTYVCDLGFFQIKKNRVKEEYSYMVETICYNELIARGYQVYIGKTYKGEVDFIAQKGEEKIYVQAAYMLSDENVIEREFGAYEQLFDREIVSLLSAIYEYKGKQKLYMDANPDDKKLSK